VVEKSRFYYPWMLFVLFGFVAGISSVCVLHRFFEPAPKKAFFAHREEITKYVESIKLGRIPTRPDRPELYRSLDVLIPYGLWAVKKDADGTIVFVFDSLPCDPTPTLIYSPHNEKDIREIKPAGGTSIGGTAIIRGEMLERHWFYCEADS
jgi:hypothetical protein